MKKRSYWSLFITVCGVFLLGACSADSVSPLMMTSNSSSSGGGTTSQNIVGTWISDDDTVISVFDFNADSTVEMLFAYPDYDLYVMQSGTWSVTSGTSMDISVTDNEAGGADGWSIEDYEDTYTVAYAFSETHLILTSSEQTDYLYDLSPASEGTLPVDDFWDYFE